MPAIRHGDEIRLVRLSVPMAEFPRLLARHLAAWPSTPKIEQLGADYIKSGFPLARTRHFVQEVCRWGNYAGVAGKVLKRNDLGFIRAQLKKAHAASISGQPTKAIKEVTSIKCLAVSFGSKHLKFLDPERAVVLDSIISERLGYRRDPDGYAELLFDCATIRDSLNDSRIPALGKGTPWRVSDVEMAIFVHLGK